MATRCPMDVCLEEACETRIKDAKKRKRNSKSGHCKNREGEGRNTERQLLARRGGADMENERERERERTRARERVVRLFLFW